MISWRVISPDPSYSGVFCYSGSEKSTIYKKNVSSVYYIFIPGNETMWHKCWCQAFNAALDLFSLNLFLGVSCIFHKIIRKFWKPLQDSRKVTARQSPEWKDVGNASLIPTYSDFKSCHRVRSQTKLYKRINWKKTKTFFTEQNLNGGPSRSCVFR